VILYSVQCYALHWTNNSPRVCSDVTSMQEATEASTLEDDNGQYIAISYMHFT